MYRCTLQLYSHIRKDHIYLLKKSQINICWPPGARQATLSLLLLDGKMCGENTVKCL